MRKIKTLPKEDYSEQNLCRQGAKRIDIIMQRYGSFSMSLFREIFVMPYHRREAVCQFKYKEESEWVDLTSLPCVWAEYEAEEMRKQGYEARVFLK